MGDSLLARLGFAALVSAVAAASAFGGYLAHRHFAGNPAASPPIVTLDSSLGARTVDQPVRRPDFSLPDTEDRVRHVSEWDGRVLVVNFWATWCPPCLHEIPLLVTLQREYGARNVQFLGIAIDEVENVRAFAREVSLNYPSLHGQREALELLRAFGNDSGALPFTAIVAPDGRVVRTQAGELTPDQAREVLEAVLAS